MLRNLIDRIGLFFRKDKESYLRLYRILGFVPHHLWYYQIALLHKSSSIHRGKKRLINNERLEFLGDAVLDAIVGDIVFKYFGDKGEGFLTDTRSKIVQRETLNKLGVQIGLDKLVKHLPTSNSHNNYMYGNAFEAIVGAMYLDQGYGCCMRFVRKRILGKYLDIEKMSKTEMNFKSKLIEWGQKYKIEIAFNLVNQNIDESSPYFKTEVLIGTFSAGAGEGYSKKESQQKASQMALISLKTDTNLKREISEILSKRKEDAQNEASCS